MIMFMVDIKFNVWLKIYNVSKVKVVLIGIFIKIISGCRKFLNCV